MYHEQAMDTSLQAGERVIREWDLTFSTIPRIQPSERKTTVRIEQRRVMMRLTDENTNQFRLNGDRRDGRWELHMFLVLPVTEWFGSIYVPIDCRLVSVGWCQTWLGSGHRCVQCGQPGWKKEMHSSLSRAGVEHVPNAHDIAHRISQASSYCRRNSSLEGFRCIRDGYLPWWRDRRQRQRTFRWFLPKRKSDIQSLDEKNLHWQRRAWQNYPQNQSRCTVDPVSKNTSQRTRRSCGDSIVQLPTANCEERIGMVLLFTLDDLSSWTNCSERIRRWSERDFFSIDRGDRRGTTNLARVKERMHVLVHGYLPEFLSSCNVPASIRALLNADDLWKNEIGRFSTTSAKLIGSSESYLY